MISTDGSEWSHGPAAASRETRHPVDDCPTWPADTHKHTLNGRIGKAQWEGYSIVGPSIESFFVGWEYGRDRQDRPHKGGSSWVSYTAPLTCEQRGGRSVEGHVAVWRTPAEGWASVPRPGSPVGQSGQLRFHQRQSSDSVERDPRLRKLNSVGIIPSSDWLTPG